MARPIKTLRLLPALTLCVLLAFPGCDGGNPREQVDDTVKELSGQKNVERMEQMKQNIGAIQDQQENRLNQLESGDDK